MGKQALDEREASKATLIGVVYLLYLLTAVLVGFLLKGIVSSSDAGLTAKNILAHEGIFRLGFATGLVGIAIYTALTTLFYGLFKPVNDSLSLLAAFCSLMGCAIQAFGSVFQLVPLIMYGGNQYLNVFRPDQLQALALLFLKLHTQADTIGLVFFGLYDLLIGCLILKSAFLPKALGVLMGQAGLGWLTFLSPPFASSLTPYNLVLGFIAELFLCLWLLVKGVDERRWREQAGFDGAPAEISGSTQTQ